MCQMEPSPLTQRRCYVLPGRGLMITQLCEIDDPCNDLRDSMEKWILGLDGFKGVKQSEKR